MPRYSVIDYASPLDGRPIAQADTLQELATATRKLADAAPMSDHDAAEDAVIADLKVRYAKAVARYGAADLLAAPARLTLEEIEELRAYFHEPHSATATDRA